MGAKKKAEKPERPTFTIPVNVSQTWAPGQTSGALMMTITDVEMSADGKPLGRVRCEALGRAIQVTVYGKDNTFTNAFQFVLEIKDLFGACLDLKQKLKKASKS